MIIKNRLWSVAKILLGQSLKKQTCRMKHSLLICLIQEISDFIMVSS